MVDIEIIIVGGDNMLKRIHDKMEQIVAAATRKVVSCAAVQDERGDTNFISIMIILGVVIVMAGVFMGFKDRIVTMVSEMIDGFTIK